MCSQLGHKPEGSNCINHTPTYSVEQEIGCSLFNKQHASELFQGTDSLWLLEFIDSKINAPNPKDVHNSVQFYQSAASGYSLIFNSSLEHIFIPSK